MTAATYYLMGYLVTNLLVFGVIGLVAKTDASSDLSSFSGLSRRSPRLAFIMLIGLLSLGGIPPFVGFFSKILVFNAAIEKGLVWLVVLGVINSVIGLYYYLRILKVMYLDPAPVEAGKIHFPARWITAATICVAGIILLGMVFNPWIQAAMRSSAGLF